MGLLNERKAEFEALSTDNGRVLMYQAAKNDVKKLKKTLRRAAFDLEYATAGYDPSENLQPGEESYWSKYLPK